MLAHLPLPSSSTQASLSIIKTTTPLLAKETHEAATGVLARSVFPVRLVALLEADVPVPSEAISLIVKEMGSVKPAVKRAFCGLAGDVFYGAEKVDFGKGSALVFAKALLPALEGSLKTVVGNPLNASGGPFEGYVAVVVLLGVLALTGKFGE